MKIERTRNTVRNMLAGSATKLFQMLAPFIMRGMMIRYMGEEYLGLNSLFTSVLHVLNLAELGVGSAMVFSMYKPISEDDHDTLCALMRLYRTYYRVIGLVVAGLGLILLPFIPYLIKGDVPDGMNVYALYLMNLGATALSYWLFAYKNSLLSAHQRNDVSSLVLLSSQVLQYALQAYIVLYLKNYYLYVLAVLVCQVFNNVCSAVIVNRMYPDYHPRGSVSKEKRQDINRRIRDLFIARLGGVVLGSADTIVISSALGLSLLAVYQNYFFIVSSIYGFVEILLSSMLAGIGNSMVVESQEKNYSDLCKFTFLFMALIFGCMCCFAGMFQPFMKIWMGEKLMLPYGMVVSFCVYFLVYELTRYYNTFKSAAGSWHQDRFRPLISAIVNLTLNILMVKRFQLYGIVWSSIAALGIVEIPWLLHNVFSSVYDRKWFKPYLRQMARFVLGGAAAWGATCGLTILVLRTGLNEWLALPLCGLMAVALPAAVYLLGYRNDREFREAMELVDRITHHKLPLKRLYSSTK